MKYQSYVLCTSPRSGSTLLCKLLAATGVAGKPGSYFHVPSLERWLRYFELSSADFETEAERLQAVFEAARQKGKSSNGVFGLRLQRHSFNFFSDQLSKLHPGLSCERERFEAAFGKTLFLYLKREDKLAQAVSCVKATQTGLWHMAPDGSEIERTSAHREPVYDAGELRRQIEVFNGYERDWQQWFDDAAISPLSITYDALSKDPQSVLLGIFDLLGLDPDRALGVELPVAKLADETNLEWIERYRSGQRFD